MSETLTEDSQNSELVSGDSVLNGTVSDGTSTSVGVGNNNTSGNNKPVQITVTNNCYSSGTKIAKDKVTLKVMVRDYNNGMTDYNDNALVKYIEKNMNVKLEFTSCNASEVSTRITLAYTSGNTPDIFMGMAPASTTHYPYIKQGKVTELSQYIDKYAPNLKQLYKNYPEAEYTTKFDDGKVYMFPMVNDRKNYSEQLFINTTWLKNVGESMPTTMEDLSLIHI